MSDGTGFLFDGLFLSSSKPKPGQKGLLLDNKYFLPLVEGGGSAEYYRCASVDTSAKTWTGYRAVLNDGVYTFEDTVTSGLSYTSVTPQVGKIYSADALVYGANLYQTIPTRGLVFYAPLAEEKTTAETGQTLTYIRTCTYETSYGINCVKIPSNSVSTPAIVFPNTNIPSGSSPSTMSCWMRTANTWTNKNSDNVLQCGTEWRAIGVGWDNKIYCIMGNGKDIESFGHDQTKWNHVCAVVGETCMKLYINGFFEGSLQITLNSPGGTSGLGCTRYSDLYIAGARIYNRELEEDEIQALYNEFTPTQENA